MSLLELNGMTKEVDCNSFRNYWVFVPKNWMKTVRTDIDAMNTKKLVNEKKL